VLERVGVKQRVDLPGVGENYQGPLCNNYQEPVTFLTCICADHNILFIPYFAADEAQTLDAIFRNDEGAIDGLTSYYT
jgi:alcohol oxidase